MAIFYKHTRVIFLFVFLNESSFFKVGKVSCQSQSFRLKFKLAFFFTVHFLGPSNFFRSIQKHTLL